MNHEFDHATGIKRVILRSPDDVGDGCTPQRPEDASGASFSGPPPNHSRTHDQVHTEAHSRLGADSHLGVVDLELIMQRHASLLGRRSVENRTATN
jgi:hypothetical protein